MPSYVTVDSGTTTYKNRVFTIGMQLELIKDKSMTWRDTEDLKAGERCIVRNIVAPLNEPHAIYLACEWERDINGHNCAADRGGLPPWSPEFLCRDGYGEWMSINEAWLRTQDVLTKPTWEL